MSRTPLLVPAADEPDVADVAQGIEGVLVPLAAVGVAAVLGWLVASLIRRLVRVSARRWTLLDSVSVRIKWPLRLLFVSIGIWAALQPTTEPSGWTGSVDRTLLILVVIAGAWLLIEFVHVVEDGILARYPVDGPDNRYARRVQTQVQILERLLTAIIVVVAGAMVLFTFPEMRAVGASVLASAGLVAIIAGVAAQSSLSNVFAGMQVAFADAIRVDDVVVVEGEWGRIEEITLTYVVVHIWDERRLVLPSTYFTSTPFQNWTRETSNLLGTVEIDVDWTVPLEGLREEMDRLLRESALWDRRVGIIQITDATGGVLRVRALASASSGPIMWDLRCYLREGLVMWLRQAGAGLPRSRFETLRTDVAAQPALPEEGGAAKADEPPLRDATSPGLPASAHDTGLFTGTYAAVQRSRPFSGPPPEVLEERHRAAERGRGTDSEPGDLPGAPPPVPPPARPTRRR